MNRPAYDPLYLRGVEYFNRRAYFSAHEVWEELWNDTDGADREFYKGIIQASVSLHHLGRGNHEGAEKLLASCRVLLEPFRPRYLGLNLDDLLAEIHACFDSPQASRERTWPKIRLEGE